MHESAARQANHIRAEYILAGTDVCLQVELTCYSLSFYFVFYSLLKYILYNSPYTNSCKFSLSMVQ